MQQYLEHPTEEALERFLMQHSQEEELEILETHILACASCIARLENLEMQIAATKIALRELQQTSRQEVRSSEKRSWKAWFSVPTLSWVGAAAVLLLGVAVIPLSTPKDVTLSAYRGSEAPSVPKWHPLHMRLNGEDLTAGPVAVQVVDQEGADVWSGKSTVSHDQVEVNLPRINKTGSYFLRLYSSAANNASGELLREFVFEVK